MEQFIETLVVAGVDREKSQRARHRGTAFQCLECDKLGVRQLNIKCRIEDHIMRRHMAEEAIPFKCSLCGFMCLKKEQILSHTTGYSRHINAAAKQQIGLTVADSLPFLMESLRPHVFGPSDYKALSQEDSLLYFLGAGDSEMQNKVIAPEAVKRSGELFPSSTHKPIVMTAAHNAFVPLVPQASTHVPLSTQLMSPVAVPEARLGLSSEQSSTESVSGSVGSVPEVQQSDLTSQLTSILQTIAGIVQTPPLMPGLGSQTVQSQTEMTHLQLAEEETSGIVTPSPSTSLSAVGVEGNVAGIGPLNFVPLSQSSALNAFRPVRSSSADQPVVPQVKSGDSETAGHAEQVEKNSVKGVVSDNKDIGSANKDNKNENQECVFPVYIPTPIERVNNVINNQELESPIPREGDVLDIEDDDMSIPTPVKRSREEEVEEPVTIKKHKEDLPVNVQDLSEKTLVHVVGEVLQVARTNMALNEKMSRAIEDSTRINGKVIEALKTLTSAVQDLNKEQKKREEQRRAFEDKWEEEWRREWNRRRDEEKREDRRREEERKDREERKKREDKRDREEEKENNTRPRSTLGRVYTKNSVVDHERKKR